MICYVLIRNYSLCQRDCFSLCKILIMNKFKTPFVLVALFFSSFVHAQTDYEWDEYGIGFSVTDDFDVTVNNVKEFTAVSSDRLIGITILPWEDATVDADELDAYLIDFGP